MSISYKFEFSYAKSGDQQKTSPPISAFAVIGGASRTIHVDSPDGVSIGSEFEQARMYKNIMLFMPGSPGASDMKTTVDLMNLANDKSRIWFHFSVTQLLNSKMIYNLTLSDGGASVRKPPTMIYGDLLMVEINLPNANITQWSSKGEPEYL